MARVETNVNVGSVTAHVNIGVHEFYESMSDTEKKEMLGYFSDTSVLEFIESQEDKQAFYKELAYQVGNSDFENLEYLIEELKYWSKK